VHLVGFIIRTDASASLFFKLMHHNCSIYIAEQLHFNVVVLYNYRQLQISCKNCYTVKLKSVITVQIRGVPRLQGVHCAKLASKTWE